LQLNLTAILFAAFLWWFSTGVIFYLNARPAHTFRWSMLAGSLVLVTALYGLWVSAGQETAAAAFIAFTCGLVIWGWHTMSYYMGVITGPRRKTCPVDARGWPRFFNALATSIYHELAIIATAVFMFWLTRGQPNLFGFWTFVLLWGMHVSAKLNVFLGVRNLNTEFIPQRLSYLTSYFRNKPMNLLFPFSVTAGTIVTIVLAQQASAAEAGTLAAVGYVLLASLMALAVIEHWFMILPIQADALWRWSLKPGSDNRRQPEAARNPALAQTVRSDADGAVGPANENTDVMKAVTRSANA